MLYNFPTSAYFGKSIPKSKFYEHISIDGRLKRKFIEQIDKIVWSYKLATETINIPSSDEILEIEVFDVYLKGDTIDEEILKVIDRAIPKPILFYIHNTKGYIKLKTAYKHPTKTKNSKWVVENYFESDWIDKDTSLEPMPMALNLQKLYTSIIDSLIPKDISIDKGDLSQKIERLKLIKSKEQEYKRLKAKRDRQKQFNKKVEINEKLHKLKQEIEELKSS